MHSIKTAQPNDLPSICKLCRRVDEALVKEGNFMWDHGYPAESDFKEDIENERLFVLKEGSRVLASASVSHNLTEDFFPISHSQKKTEDIMEIISYEGETLCSLHRLMVDPAYWRKGLASELMDFLLKKYPGATWVFASYNGNNKALSFYHKKGFILYGLYSDFEWGNDSVQYLWFKKAKRDGLCSL